jgi:hypothetical protein
MKICISGTYGTSSLVSRLLYDEFSILHKPTLLTTIYKVGKYEVVDVPNQDHAVPIQCDILILTCKTQQDVEHIARKWFGKHKHLFVVLVDSAPEIPLLCPAEHLIHINNMTRDGLINLVQQIRAYK